MALGELQIDSGKLQVQIHVLLAVDFKNNPTDVNSVCESKQPIPLPITHAIYTGHNVLLRLK